MSRTTPAILRTRTFTFSLSLATTDTSFPSPFSLSISDLLVLPLPSLMRFPLRVRSYPPFSSHSPRPFLSLCIFPFPFSSVPLPPYTLHRCFSSLDVVKRKTVLSSSSIAARERGADCSGLLCSRPLAPRQVSDVPQVRAQEEQPYNPNKLLCAIKEDEANETSPFSTPTTS